MIGVFPKVQVFVSLMASIKFSEAPDDFGSYVLSCYKLPGGLLVLRDGFFKVVKYKK